MIVIIGFFLGALIGALMARRRKGKPLDILQYAVSSGLAFAVVGIILTVLIDRIAG